MALERDFITPDDMVVTTTANVVGNTVSVDMFSNTHRSNTSPVFNQNFVMSPYLDSRWTFTRTSNATYLAANGIISIATANTPRFDYDPVTLQGKGLLMEESRRNDVWNSNFATNAANWGIYDGFNNQNLALVANAGVAPDGTNTAAFFYHTTDVSTYYVTYPTTSGIIANNVTYTFSIFVKANTSPQEPGFVLAQYNQPDNVNSIYLQFTVAANGSISGWTDVGAGANVRVQSVGSQNYPNGWVRVYYSFRYTTGNRSYVQFKTELTSSGLTTAGANVRGLYLWGAQLEQGPFPTSVIPTPFNGTAVRASEAANITGDNLNTFKDDSSMTIVDTISPIGYHGNTTMISTTEQRFNQVWTLFSNPAPSTPSSQYNPPIGNNSVGTPFTFQSVDSRYLNDGTVPHRVQRYLGMFNQIENYIGFHTYDLPVNNHITNSTSITTATTMRSNNFIMVSNGNLSSTTLNYFGGANNNNLQIGTINGYLERFAVYRGQLSNTELINITRT